MDEQNLPVYEIQVEGHLDSTWAGWFDGLAVCELPGGETLLRGPLADQAALFGLLKKIHGLNLPLVSVRRVAPETPATVSPKD